MVNLETRTQKVDSKSQKRGLLLEFAKSCQSLSWGKRATKGGGPDTKAEAEGGINIWNRARPSEHSLEPKRLVASHQCLIDDPSCERYCSRKPMDRKHEVQNPRD
jgi:hypothetical protein